MKHLLSFLFTAAAVVYFSFVASAQGPMGGGMPPMGGGMPMGGFPGMGMSSGSSTQDKNYSKKLSKILTADQFQKWEDAKAAKAASKPAMGGFQMPEGFQLPEGFTPGQMPQGMPQGMPEGFQMPEGGFQMPQGEGAEVELSEEDSLEASIGSLLGAEIKRLAQLRTDRMVSELGLNADQAKKLLKLNTNDIRIRQNSGGGGMGMGGMMGGMPMGGMPMF